MKIYLRDSSKELAQSWRDAFNGCEDVDISHGDIFDIPVETIDAVVSPANSFGFMDGGIDQVYSDCFGWEITPRLQKIIREKWNGELPVGCAIIFPTGDDRFPHCISAPTMRIPTDIQNAPNAYLAFKASLHVAAKTNFESILCPGLGTGVGNLPAKRCAQQMKLAYDHFKAPSFPDRLSTAKKEHIRMCV